jgi:hypothetical protein
MPDEIVQDTPVEVTNDKRALKEMLFYKLDRTLAIMGIIALGGMALYIRTAEAMQVTSLAMGALAGYIGGRTGKE